MNGAVGGSHDAGVSESAKSVEETLSAGRLGGMKFLDAGPNMIH